MKKSATRKILFTNKTEGGYTIVTVNANKNKSALFQLFRNIIGAKEIDFGESFYDIENAIPKKERTWKHNFHENIYLARLYPCDPRYKSKTIPNNMFRVISIENVTQYDEKEFSRYGNIVTTLDINDDFNKYAILTEDLETVLDESTCIVQKQMT